MNNLTIRRESEIVAEMQAHINAEGGPFSSWYVGITNDIERRLFNEHGVPRQGHWYVFRQSLSHEVARRIEQHFLDLGCDGDTGGGDTDSTIVYAYKKASFTNP